MKPRVVWSTIIIWFSILSSQAFAQNTFPYLAVTNIAKINIRAGQSENFEKIGQLVKGDEVIVLEHSYSWLKIQLPADAEAYIHSQYILKINDKIGLVSGDRVNVRAKANVDNTVIAQLSKGDQVTLISQEGDWYKILPDKNFYGWVKDDLLQFKSQDISSYKAKIVSIPSATDNTPVKKKSANQVESTKKDSAVAAGNPAGHKLRIKGTLEPVHKEKEFPYKYQLTSYGQLLYYLTGIKDGIDSFLYYDVEVEGNVITDKAKIPMPVLEIQQIQLVL